jgi:AcrR family transcriptional regulator
MNEVDIAEAPARKRDAPRTKAAILQAAKEAFSTQGYAQTGIRDIAARAGINSSLVVRYFGSKEALFEAALTDALDPKLLMAGGRENFGRHVAQALSGPRSGVDSAAIIILAIADSNARAVSARLVESITHRALAKWIGAPDAADRAARISILCTGFLIYRRHVPIAPISSRLRSSTVDWLARSLQAIVDGDA